MINIKDFYRREWKEAEKSGNLLYAVACKEAYRQIILKQLECPMRFYDERLKAYPTIYLN